MSSLADIRTLFLSILLLAPATLVHWPDGQSSARAQAQRGKSKEMPKATVLAPAPPAAAAHSLPAPVAEMRNAILAAVRSGRLQDLTTAIEWNELEPDITGTRGEDPIGYLTRQSGDGQGLEILAILGNLLDGPYAIVPMGRDIENNRVFVWPAIAEVPFANLTSSQEVELFRLAPLDAVKAMKAKGRYTYWRLMIGADGTWHSFRRTE